jgi:hypothetical protein
MMEANLTSLSPAGPMAATLTSSSPSSSLIFFWARLVVVPQRWAAGLSSTKSSSIQR